MANAYSGTTRQFSTPYLTVAEFKQAPTAIDYNNLVVGSTDPAVQDAELANVIARASSWVDTYCNQILGATTDTENQRVRMRSDGTVAIHPRYWPILAVTNLSLGGQPNLMYSVPNPAVGWIEDQSFIYPWNTASLNYSSQGPLQFGMPSSPRAQMYASITYVNGYASTLLAASVSLGASSLTVANGVGLLPNSMVTIYDGLNTENVTVASTYTFGSTTVPLAAPLSHAHSAGVSISALPPSIKEATILATTAFLKVRGDNSLTMAVTNAPSMAVADSQRFGSDLAIAKELLKPFRRIR